MDFATLDLLIRAACVGLLLLLGSILLRDHRDTLPGRLAILLALGVMAYFIVERPGFRSLNWLDMILFGWEVSVFGIFWLFSRVWFNDETHIGWRSWAIVAFSILFSLGNSYYFKTTGAQLFLADSLMRLMWLALSGWGIWIAWRGRRNDLVEARRKLRTMFIWAVGSAVFGTTAIFYVRNLFFEATAAGPIILLLNFAVLLIILFLAFSILRVSPADLFAASEAKKQDLDIAALKAQEAMEKRLHNHMERQRAYRDEALTIAGLAEALGEREYRLRRLINGRLGYRNFPAFLNHYRLCEVRDALVDPDQRTVPILTIALDAGFGSLAPFNRAFREAEGMTPSQYRRKNMGQTAA